MKIKVGDVVKAHDISFSAVVRGDSSLKDYYSMHIGLCNSDFNKQTDYRVVAIGVNNLPSFHPTYYPEDASMKFENDTIIQDVQTKEIIFIKAKYLYSLCLCCGQEIK